MANKEETAALKTIAKGAGFVFAGMIISKFLTYFYRLIVARWLGPEEYGLISLGLAVVGVGLMLSTLGLPAGVVRFVSYYIGKKKETYAKGVIITALKYVSVLSLVVVAVLLFYSDWLALDFFHNHTFLTVLIISILTIPFVAVAAVFIQAIYGFRVAKYAVYAKSIAEPGVRLMTTILLLYFGLGVVGAAGAIFFGAVISMLLALYYLHFKTFPVFSRKIKARFRARELFAYSWPLTFVALLSMVLGWTDTVMLGYFTGPESVGVYNAALPTAQLVMIFYVAIIALFTPVITRFYSMKKTAEMKSVFRRVSRWIFSFTFPTVLLLAMFSTTILRLLFGHEYVGASTALVILSAGYFIVTLVGPTTETLNSIGKTKVNLFNALVAASANILLNIYLIPIYGIVGAATATAFSFVLLNVLSVLEVYYFVRVQPFSLWFLKPTAASLLSASIVFIVIKSLFKATPFWALILALGAFLVLYVVVLLLLKSFDKEDIEMMRAVERKSGLRIMWLRNLVKIFSD